MDTPIRDDRSAGGGRWVAAAFGRRCEPGRWVAAAFGRRFVVLVDFPMNFRRAPVQKGAPFRNFSPYLCMFPFFRERHSDEETPAFFAIRGRVESSVTPRSAEARIGRKKSEWSSDCQRRVQKLPKMVSFLPKSSAQNGGFVTNRGRSRQSGSPPRACES